MPPYNAQTQFRNALLGMEKIRAARQKETDTQEFREQTLSLREAQLRLAEEASQVKEQGELLKTRLMHDQVRQTGAAQELISELDPSSLYFPKALNKIRALYPEAFRNPDSVVAEAAKQLNATFEKNLAYHQERAKELGIDLYNPNPDAIPGFNKETGTIDWDKARKAREGWNRENAAKMGLAPASLDSAGNVRFSNQEQIHTMTAQDRQTRLLEYAQRKALLEYEKAKKDSLASEANVALLEQQLAQSGDVIDRDGISLKAKLEAARTALSGHKQILSDLEPLIGDVKPQVNPHRDFAAAEAQSVNPESSVPPTAPQKSTRPPIQY